MAEDAGGTTETRTEDMHWGLLLRADIQDLRQDIRDFRQEVQHDMRDIRQDLIDHRSEFRTLVDNRFYWTIGIMLTLFTMQSGLMVGLLKL
ncbi:MAG: hypothetical protein HOM68_18160 [Gemmatimonadetes bacterium]|jgi:transcriptional antiterminator|nr:hypothetical protein [Gemmatimonadota bacterium]MBT5144752.1 hypothetical protein [Gemmatimonadota bacterium]MBT5592050.1 hypothetical protein [Gemmatimonadota bacterium]MBT5962924.1 hypothetical protein [Gemmatimonadota bacterium]